MLDALLKLLPGIRAGLEAKLSGVNGYTGRGEIEFAARKNGARKLGIELRGVAGREAEFCADDQFTATVSLKNGRADQTFSTNRGDDVPELKEGAHVEVRQNGQTILQGVLARD